jgi:hypothetical protein
MYLFMSKLCTLLYVMLPRVQGNNCSLIHIQNSHWLSMNPSLAIPLVPFKCFAARVVSQLQNYTTVVFVPLDPVVSVILHVQGRAFASHQA